MCSFLLFMEIILWSLAFLPTWQCCAWPYVAKVVDHPWRSREGNSLSLWAEQEVCTNARSQREGEGRTTCRWLLFSKQSLQPSLCREENFCSVGSKLTWCGWWHKLDIPLGTPQRRKAGLLQYLAFREVHCFVSLPWIDWYTQTDQRICIWSQKGEPWMAWS